MRAYSARTGAAVGELNMWGRKNAVFEHGKNPFTRRAVMKHLKHSARQHDRRVIDEGLGELQLSRREEMVQRQLDEEMNENIRRDIEAIDSMDRSDDFDYDPEPDPRDLRDLEEMDPYHDPYAAGYHGFDDSDW